MTVTNMEDWSKRTGKMVMEFQECLDYDCICRENSFGARMVVRIRTTKDQKFGKHDQNQSSRRINRKYQNKIVYRESHDKGRNGNAKRTTGGISKTPRMKSMEESNGNANEGVEKVDAEKNEDTT